MTFKEKEQLIAYLVSKYSYKKHVDLRDDVYRMNHDLIRIVEFTLRQLDDDSRRIITNDFIEKKRRYWWDEYYSRTTYYRLKNVAMHKFINCLHNGKMI